MVVCGAAALPLGLLAEGLVRPFLVDNSLGYFWKHLHELTPLTWLLLILGAVLAFLWGKDARYSWPMTAAKLQAARDLEVRIVMVQRPPLPRDTMAVGTVAEAVRWISRDNAGA